VEGCYSGGVNHGRASAAGVFVETILEAVTEVADAGLEKVCVGAYWTVVRTSGSGTGMASSLRSEAHLHGERPVEGAGRLHERSAAELAVLLRSRSAPEASIGLAAANALLNDAAQGLTETKAVEVLCERGARRRVAMVGRFPFADALREHCDQLWVFERGLNRRREDFGEESMGQLLPQADVVAVTATTLLNHTLPSVLACVRPDAFVMMLGPSTPLTPALFEFGFDILCGTLIEEPEAVLRAVGQGAVTGQIKGVRRVSLWRKPA
jgi:uncharacterized protein (DUF4213/DUF364 family)